jgi:hypothetical protein
LIKQVNREDNLIDDDEKNKIISIRKSLIKLKTLFFNFIVDHDDKLDYNANIDYVLNNDDDDYCIKDYFENIYFIKLIEILADLYIKCECYTNAIKILSNLVYSYE